MADVVNIKQINPNTFEFQEYSSADTSLISSLDINSNFDPDFDYLEYFVYDLNNNIVFQNTSGYPNFTLLDNQVSVDPEANLISSGYNQGTYNTLYNFLSNKLGSNSFTKYYIEEISSNRTEIRLNSTQISSAERIFEANLFISELEEQSASYPDFYLNFDDNQLVIANNIKLDGDTILIKLYEPLPSSFGVKSELWVVEKIATSLAYNISITSVFEIEDDNISLKGPNFNISVKNNINNSTEYKTYSSLSTTTDSQGSGSLQYHLNSILAEKGIKINVDYNDYSNFIHFSSAQTRLENFYYKLSLIEEYNLSASYSNNNSGSYYVSSSNNIFQEKIDEIITQFDGYEQFLYFESGSKSWPKTNSIPPYTNAPSTNPGVGYNFFLTQSITASVYDAENDDALINTVPEYLRDDPDNDKYELFIEMLGQQFDNIYLYIQSITDKFDADNRLNYGISKDLVADAIRELGVKIYQNNFSVDDLYIGLLGITPSGSLLGLPGTTGSLPAPSGFEYIDTYVTASNTGSLYPTSDINKSIYKRIYHNLPYLLKKKGTVEGLRTLINIYGIPDTILRISEFGGKDKINTNDWDYWQNVYNFKFDTQTDGTIDTDWSINTDWGASDDVPESLQFRFKTQQFNSSNLLRSQSIWSLDDGDDVRLVLESPGDPTSGSYNGSIPDPQRKYAYLKFFPNHSTNPNLSASVFLPFRDGEWWSVMITRQDGDKFTLYAADKIYNGKDGYEIGFIASSSVTASNDAPYYSSTTSHFPANTPISGYDNLTGSYQEIRYFNTTLTDTVFRDYTMNPNSIEGSTFSSSQDELVFRASLGGELYTGSVSIHPKITGSAITNSFAANSNFTINNGIFTSNKEVFFYDQVPAGIKNRNTNKLKQINTVLPPTSGSFENIPVSSSLSPFISVQQNSYVSESYTADVDYVEIAFSPQNEINDDIISSLGYFNIGDYIGDPRQISSSAESYPDLNELRDQYFEKYKSNYDLWDYIRLIKYLDNSLFKMLKDFTPARTSLASGVVIKQHLLERNKYPTPQLDTHTTTSYQFQNDPFVFQNLEVTGSSIITNTVTGSNGGTMPELNGEISGSGPGFNIVPITQSWNGILDTITGPVGYTASSQHEFFDGELSGSTLIATTQSLNPGNPFLQVSTTLVNYSASISSSEYFPLSTFLASSVSSGHVQLWFDSSSIDI